MQQQYLLKEFQVDVEIIKIELANDMQNLHDDYLEEIKFLKMRVNSDDIDDINASLLAIEDLHISHEIEQASLCKVAKNKISRLTDDIINKISNPH